MKHELDSLLRSQVRRELREAPAGLRSRVMDGLAGQDAPPARPSRSRLTLVALAAGLLVALLAGRALWPSAERAVELSSLPRAGAPVLALGLADSGLALAARVDQPLAREWRLLVRDSREICSAMLQQLPRLPPAQ